MQDAYLKTEQALWGSLRIVLTVIMALFSVQSGLIVLGLSEPENPAFFAIPLGILALCGVGWKNAHKDYRVVMEYVACMAKVEEELDFSRKPKEQREFFVDDESILCDRWKEGRGAHSTTESFVKDNSKIRRFRTYGIIKLIFIFIIALDGFLLLYPKILILLQNLI